MPAHFGIFFLTRNGSFPIEYKDVLWHTRHMRANVPISADTIAAMRTLVQAGVSDEAIGRAMRDLLMAGESDTLTATPATRLEEEVPPSGPATGTPVSVSEAPATYAQPTAPLPPPAPVIAGTVALKVRFQDGKSSNVTIPAQLLHDVGLRIGGEEAARQKVRDLARAVPDTVANRSGWIQSELSALVPPR
jgi:hypothetical protein